jgi:uncharacterized protein YndB with AHSA1/START domain
MVEARVSRLYEAPAEQVFDAFLDPAVAGRFLFATPGGEMVRAETDPRVGGRFVFTDRRDGEDVEHVGEYLALDRPRRIVFRFAVPRFAPEQTTVAIDIAPLEAGSALTLTHGLAPGHEAMLEKVEQGWGMILDRLAEALKG